MTRPTPTESDLKCASHLWGLSEDILPLNNTNGKGSWYSCKDCNLYVFRYEGSDFWNMYAVRREWRDIPSHWRMIDPVSCSDARAIRLSTGISAEPPVIKTRQGGPLDMLNAVAEFNRKTREEWDRDMFRGTNRDPDYSEASRLLLPNAPLLNTAKDWDYTLEILSRALGALPPIPDPPKPEPKPKPENSRFANLDFDE